MWKHTWRYFAKKARFNTFNHVQQLLYLLNFIHPKKNEKKSSVACIKRQLDLPAPTEHICLGPTARYALIIFTNTIAIVRKISWSNFFATELNQHTHINYCHYFCTGLLRPTCINCCCAVSSGRYLRLCYRQ